MYVCMLLVIHEHGTPIINHVGEWWKHKDLMEIPGDTHRTGGEPPLSDAFTINGQPGYLYPCSKTGTFYIHQRI